MRRYSDHKKAAVTKPHVVVWNVRSFLGEVRADARTMARTMAIVTMATMKKVPLSALEVSFSRLDIGRPAPIIVLRRLTSARAREEAGIVREASCYELGACEARNCAAANCAQADAAERSRRRGEQEV